MANPTTTLRLKGVSAANNNNNTAAKRAIQYTLSIQEEYQILNVMSRNLSVLLEYILNGMLA